MKITVTENGDNYRILFSRELENSPEFYPRSHEVGFDVTIMELKELMDQTVDLIYNTFYDC